ncbi:MAG: extracellular solute-binding protein [Actinomycetota bacterium]|nr:extracellular solute-binding protein [Actinomycetota bacterium]
MSGRRRRWKAPSITLCALFLAVLLPGCGQGQERLTIYSGRTENLVGPLLERFSKETDIPIDVRYGDSSDLALLLAEEGRRSTADVFLSQAPGPAGFLAAEGLLGRLDKEALERVSAGSRDPEGRWVGTTARVRVLVYNRDLAPESELPRSVLEVTQPKYRGQVGVAPTNASFQDFVTAMRSLLGEDRTRAFLRGLAENQSATYANNNAIVEAVGRGEIRFGLVNHYYALRFLDEDPSLPIRNHFFRNGDIGSLLLVSPAAILTSSTQKDQARRFIDYLLDREAQEYFRNETFEYPLAVGVEPLEDLPPLETLNLRAYHFRDSANDLKETTEMIAESGLER